MADSSQTRTGESWGSFLAHLLLAACIQSVAVIEWMHCSIARSWEFSSARHRFNWWRRREAAVTSCFWQKGVCCWVPHQCRDSVFIHAGVCAARLRTAMFSTQQLPAGMVSSFMWAFVLPVWEQQSVLYPASCHPLVMLCGQHSLFSDDWPPDPAVLLKHCQLDPGSHSLFSDHWPLAVFLKRFVCWTQATGSLRTAAVCKVPVGMGKIKGHVYSKPSTDLTSRLKYPKPEWNPTDDATHCQRTDHCLLRQGTKQFQVHINTPPSSS